MYDFIKEGESLYKNIIPDENTLSAPFSEYMMFNHFDYNTLVNWKADMQWLKDEGLPKEHDEIERIAINRNFIINHGINKSEVRQIFDKSEKLYDRSIDH